MNEYSIEQRKSEKGKSFPQMHIHIMNVKGWLRGIHHHCSKERMQGYLDEYHFRFNRRNNMDTIFDVLIRRMVNNYCCPLKIFFRTLYWGKKKRLVLLDKFVNLSICKLSVASPHHSSLLTPHSSGVTCRAPTFTPKTNTPPPVLSGEPFLADSNNFILLKMKHNRSITEAYTYLLHISIVSVKNMEQLPDKSRVHIEQISHESRSYPHSTPIALP